MNASLWQLAGWTMIHSLWIGAAVALAGGIVRLAARRATPNTRYAISLATLATLAISPLAAAAWLSVNGVPQLATTHSESIPLLPPGVGEPGISDAQFPFPTASDYAARNSAYPLLHPSLTLPIEGREPEEHVQDAAALTRSSAPIVIDLAHSSPPPQPAGEWGDGFDPLPAISPANATAAGDFPNATVGSPSASFSPAIGAPLPTDHQSPIIDHLSRLAAAIPYLPILWLVGAPLTFALLAAGLVGSERLRRRATPLVAGPAFDACQRMRTALRITRRVALAACDGVAQPVLVGVFRPLILLPTAALAGWTPEQLDMILLHELAHVRRWDNLVNLLQRIVESILFYHPAVWILSRQVRHDREECCDATVIRHTDRPHQYAELLVSIAAALRGGPAPSLAVASAMASHPLAGRIRRILNIEAEPMRITRRTLAATLLLPLLLAGAILYSGANAEDGNSPPSKGGARGGIPDASLQSALASNEQPQEDSTEANQTTPPDNAGEQKTDDNPPPHKIVTYPIKPGTLVDPLELCKAIQGHVGVEMAIVKGNFGDTEQVIALSAPEIVHEHVRNVLHPPAANNAAQFQSESQVPQPSTASPDEQNAPADLKQSTDNAASDALTQALADVQKTKAARVAAEERFAAVRNKQAFTYDEQIQTAAELAISSDLTLRLLGEQARTLESTLERVAKAGLTESDANAKQLHESLAEIEQEIADRREAVKADARKRVGSPTFEGQQAYDELQTSIRLEIVRRADAEVRRAETEFEKSLQRLTLLVRFPNQPGAAANSPANDAQSTANNASPANDSTRHSESEISQLQTQISSIEAEIRNTQEELTNLEVFKQLAQQGASSSALIEKAIAMELDKDQSLKALENRLLSIDRFVALEESNLADNATDQEREAIANLSVLRKATAAKRDAYRAEAAKKLRDRIAKMPNETLRSAMVEYSVRRRIADEKLVNYQQELDAARKKMSQLGANNAPAQPQPPASRTPSKTVGIFDEATLKKLFESRPDNPILTVNYALDQLPPEQYEDQWNHMFDGMKLDPYGPQLAFEHETAADKRHMKITAPAQAHREFFETFFSGELLKAELAAPKQKSPGPIKQILVDFLPELSKEDHARIVQEIKATGLSAMITTRKPQTKSSAAVKTPTESLPCLSVLVPKTWQAKPVWETNTDGEKTLRIINEAESPLAQPADASPAWNNDAPTLGSSPTPPTGASPPPESLFANAAGSSSPTPNAPSTSTAAPAPQPRPTPSSDWNLSAPAASSAPVPSLAPIDPASNPWGQAAPQLAAGSAPPAINPQIVPQPADQPAGESSAWNPNTANPYAGVDQTSPFAAPYHADYATNGGIPADFAGLVDAAKNKHDGSITWDEAFTTLHVYGPAKLHADVQRYLQWLSTKDTTNPPSNLDLNAITGRHRKTNYELRKGSRPIVEAWFAEHPSHGLSYHIAEPNEAPNLVARGPKEAHEQLMAALVNLGILRSTSSEPPQPSAPMPTPHQSPPFPTLEHQRIADRAYKLLGLELEPADGEDLERIKKLGYAGGLRVLAVDNNKRNGIGSGALLVGLHVWPTTDMQALDAVLTRQDLDSLSPLKYRAIQEFRTDRRDDSDNPIFEDRISSGRIPIDSNAYSSIQQGLAANNDAAPANAPASPASDFATVQVLQSPTSTKAGLLGGGSTTTAYLRVKLDRQSRFFTSASERMTPQQLEERATIYLKLIKSSSLLKAALKIAPPEQIDAEAVNPVEWLKDRLSATFPGGGEILELRLTGAIGDEDAKILQAIIDCFIAETNAPPGSPADPTATPAASAASEPTFLYDGKTFEQWRDLWKNELNPERRADAISALSAFSRAGRSEDAVNAILDVAAEYDFGYPDDSHNGGEEKLKERIVEELTIPNDFNQPQDPWIPLLINRMKQDPKKWQKLAQRLYTRMGPPYRGNSTISPQNLELLKRCAADPAFGPNVDMLTMLYWSAPNDEEVKQLAKETLTAQDTANALKLLRNMGFGRLEEFPEQFDFLFNGDAEIRKSARTTLNWVSRSETYEAIVPKLLAILEDPDQSSRHVDAIRALAAIAMRNNARGVGPPLLTSETHNKITERMAKIFSDGLPELLPPAFIVRQSLMHESQEMVLKIAEPQVSEEQMALLKEAVKALPAEAETVIAPHPAANNQQDNGGMGGGAAGGPGGGFF